MIKRDRKFILHMALPDLLLPKEQIFNLNEEKSILEEINSIMDKLCKYSHLHEMNSSVIDSTINTGDEYLSYLTKKKIDLESKIELLTRDILELRRVNTKLLDKIISKLAINDKEIKILSKQFSLLSNLTKFRLIKNNLKNLFNSKRSERDQNQPEIFGYLYNINSNKIIPIFNYSTFPSLESIQFFWTSLQNLHY
jgi:hypothetical protein